MALVLLALLPAVLGKAWLYGPRFAENLLLAIGFALALEALMLRLRRQPLRPFLGDLSAVVTAVLFVLLLPPATPWWLLGLGLCSALVLAKHAYGGLGENLFNPAMLGYAVLLVAFPGHLGRDHPAVAELPTANGWIACAYALGGLVLIAKRIIPWQTPLATLGAAVVAHLALSADAVHSPALGLPEMLSGALLLAAFYIATDPVTGCLSDRGRLAFGAGVGLLTVIITHAGGTPDGLPFAVLLMNCAAPWIDEHTRPSPLRPAVRR